MYCGLSRGLPSSWRALGEIWKTPNPAGNLTSLNEFDGDPVSYFSSGSSVSMEDTVVVGDEVSEAI